MTSIPCQVAFSVVRKAPKLIVPARSHATLSRQVKQLSNIDDQQGLSWSAKRRFQQEAHMDCTDEVVMFTEADANLKLDQLGDHEIQPPSPYLDNLLHSDDPNIIGRQLITATFEIDPVGIVLVSCTVNVSGKNYNMHLTPGYYGNAFAYPTVCSKAHLLCENPLEHAMEIIKEAKAKMSEDYIRSLADLMVIRG
ncbi:hypothetical protein LWI28_015396 [Acer negundo]|uniref:Uncharacterized protein n=1 Tax=Acer negundo TaxID=4023 RepID=A0AAD5JD69_ACENE|nr:hypothetical protein LWI28_015396 [Acer negundo]